MFLAETFLFQNLLSLSRKFDSNLCDLELNFFS